MTEPYMKKILTPLERVNGASNEQLLEAAKNGRYRITSNEDGICVVGVMYNDNLFMLDTVNLKNITIASLEKLIKTDSTDDPHVIKLFNIWREGYACTGQRAGACLVAESVPGVNFRDACQKYYKGNGNYGPERNTDWGCHLFDNQEDAIKSFG